MASPFDVFRKNPKAWLAVIGIMAMIAFVVGSFGIQMIGANSGGRRDDPVVMTWQFGNLRQSDIEQRMTMRRILNAFLVQANHQASRRGGGQPVPTNHQFFPVNESAIVQTMVMAKKAEELGIVISDSFVNEILRKVTNDKIKPAELDSIAKEFGQRATPNQIFDALRTELMAQQAFQMFEMADATLDAHPPAQRWEYFNRLQRRVDAQTLAVPVAEYSEQVKDPGDKELKEFFEKYKSDYANPASPDPGFHQPYRAKFQYFKADFDTVLADEIPKVTEQEIAEYYEKNKKQFPASKLPPLRDDIKPDTEKTSSEKSSSEKTDENKPDAEKSDAEKPATEKADAQKLDAKKTDGSEADGKKSISEKSDSKTDGSKQDKLEDSDATPDDAKQDGTKKDGDKKDGDKSSLNPSAGGSPFRLAKFQPTSDSKDAVKDAKNSTADEKTDAVKADATKNEATKSDAAKSDTATKETATKETATKETVKSAAANSVESNSDDAKNAIVDEPTPDSLKVPKLKKDDAEYKTLDQARNDIRQVIARQKAIVAIDGKLTKLRSIMSRYNDDYKQWKILSVKDPNEPKPRPLDMLALAQDHRVILHETKKPISALEANVAKLDIAQSEDRTNYNPRQGNFGTEWLRTAFTSKDLFRPALTQDLEMNRYLSWKVAQEEDHIPKFDEVREQVLDAWKLAKARKVTKEKADEYAAIVNQRKEPMREVFAGDKNLPVAEVNGISWLTDNNMPFSQQQQPPRISNVPNVEYAGENFMETMFGLEAMQAGVAFNHPQTVAYVIQVTNPNELPKQEFMVRGKNYERIRNAGYFDSLAARQAWLKSLENQYGVKWERMAKAGDADE